MTTTTTDPLDESAIAAHLSEATDPLPEFTTVKLRLQDRTVSFTAKKVSSIPDLFGDSARTGGPMAEDMVYLTAKHKVAIYGRRLRTLEVLDLGEFVGRFYGSPVSWIVDDVLDAMPNPFEHLDI